MEFNTNVKQESNSVRGSRKRSREEFEEAPLGSDQLLSRSSKRRKIEVLPIMKKASMAKKKRKAKQPRLIPLAPLPPPPDPPESEDEMDFPLMPSLEELEKACRGLLPADLIRMAESPTVKVEEDEPVVPARRVARRQKMKGAEPTRRSVRISEREQRVANAVDEQRLAPKRKDSRRKSGKKANK